MILFTIPNIAGTITLITVAPTASTRGGLIVAFYFMQFFQAVRSLLALKYLGRLTSVSCRITRRSS